jgi:uncharacterized tellurite resistance protein B-like protein
MLIDVDGLVRKIEMDEEWQICSWDHVLAVEFPLGITPETAKEILTYAAGASVREPDLSKFITAKMREYDREKRDWCICMEE